MTLSVTFKIAGWPVAPAPPRTRVKYLKKLTCILRCFCW